LGGGRRRLAKRSGIWGVGQIWGRGFWGEGRPSERLKIWGVGVGDLPKGREFGVWDRSGAKDSGERGDLAKG